MDDSHEDLRRLEREIQRLKVEFDRFFNGALATPPEELRTEVTLHLRRLRSQHKASLAERFLFNTLEARFNSLNELCNRKLREAEAGLVARGGGSAPDAYTGVAFSGRDSQDEAMALYRELYGTAGRQKKTDFGSFVDFLDQKAAQIRKMTGCRSVQFRVTEQDGRLTLKAKPLDPTTA